VGRPATARGRRQFLYVNRRLVRDRALVAAFYRAVREEWRSDDAPALFLFLDLPPASVDVNVHPQKAEVRFRDTGLLERVGAALRQGLVAARGEGPVPLRLPPSIESPPPAAWEGAGGWSRAGSVAEGGRLAEAVYGPPVVRPVRLSGRNGAERSLRLLGQYKGTLILLEGPDGLYVIDQHVAHERVLYERLRRELAAEAPVRQALLTPVLLSLSAVERLRLAELGPELEACGFSLTEFSGGDLAVTALPAGLAHDEAEAILLAVAHAPELGEGGAGLRRTLLEGTAAARACRAAVKMHEPLSGEEMQRLVSELFAAEQPYACPHGRPIVLKMSDADLERRFGRR
jgi:DNA mismatch repair protein MutL